ncbi:hypothetical protein SAPIO_CDS4947 [Scedosporium apiospermum]|uniref:Heterokaryon incompatibility domain-containing protein n=1 Tax=Pseudallescheria apiosperma TaxID=563466 RepID=A0A084G7D9_PSEDA|nr:uncharacterized protein SAPIO_CDS4947 [Scedosporium apiospermum]KEZ43251.1 hypothetical protein SAPIO_CDS4947 [Scedosporium apiospermum]
MTRHQSRTEYRVSKWVSAHKVKTALKQPSHILRGKLQEIPGKTTSEQHNQNQSISDASKDQPGSSDSREGFQSMVRRLETIASGILKSYRHLKYEATGALQTGHRIYGKRLSLILREIRTVILLPSADPDAQIQCTFSRRILGLANTVSSSSYSALSYVWGERSHPRTILVDGAPVPITANLFAALRRLRRDREPLELWVDALCINQDDVQERNHQVRLMGDVYKRADEVLMWLGEAEDDSHLAAELVDTLHGIIRGKDPRETGNEDRKAQSILDLCLGEGIAPGLQALNSLLDRQYWDRVWIVQEVLLSKRLYVCYGSFRQPWEHWLAALSLIGSLPVEVLPDKFKSTPAEREVKPVYSLVTAYMKGLRFKKRMSLLDGLILYRNREATDPRDHVYAILNLVDGKKSGIQADYSLSVFSLYRSVVVQTIERSRDLDILSACKRSFSESSSTDGSELYGRDFDKHMQINVLAWIKVLPEADASGGAQIEAWVPAAEALLKDVRETVLPSWIPDWRIRSLDSAQINTIGNCPFKASGNFPPVVEFINETLMAAAGIHVGVISAVAPATVGGLRIDSDWAMWRDETHPKHVYGDLRKQKEAFIHTALTGRNADGTRRTAPVLVEAMHSVFKLDDAAEDHQDTTKDQCLEEGLKQPEADGKDDGMSPEDDNALILRSFHFTFCATENGFMGRVPIGTRVGDVVVILLGAKVPFIVRKYEDFDMYYLVGECYVHGVMDGEMLEDLEEAKTKMRVFCLVVVVSELWVHYLYKLFLSEGPSADTARCAFHPIFMRGSAWWSRIWTMQEAILSPSSTMLWGPLHMLQRWRYRGSEASRIVRLACRAGRLF